MSVESRRNLGCSGDIPEHWRRRAIVAGDYVCAVSAASISSIVAAKLEAPSRTYVRRAFGRLLPPIAATEKQSADKATVGGAAQAAEP